jgi:ABC-type transporter Mla subunit MlaD
MKNFSTKILTLNIALVAMLAAVAGCVSKSYDKGAATSTALQQSADAVAQTSTKVNDLLAALNNLTFKSQGDLRNQYDAFVSAAKNLNEQTDRLDAKVIQMRNAAASFTESWSNQLAAIQSPELRQRSAERMNEIAAKLKDADASYEGVKNSFKPFMADIKDIQTYLGTDLTAGGLNTIKDIVSKTKVDAVPLRDSIKQLQGSFSNLGNTLSPVLPSADQK